MVASAERIACLLEALNRRLAAVELAAVTAIMAVMFALNAYAIASRYLLQIYPAWNFEITEMLLVSMVMLGGAWLYRARRQIAVTIIVQQLPPGGRLRRALSAITELAILVFAIVTIWQAICYQPILLGHSTPVLGLPGNSISILVPVAYASILLTSLCNLLALRRAAP